jgi:hypothetical protein
VNEEIPIIILAGVQSEGTTYQLHPVSKDRLAEAFPGVQQAPTVFVGYDTQADFETIHGPMWAQIAMLLTGVSLEKLLEIAPVLIRVPASGKEFEVTE